MKIHNHDNVALRPRQNGLNFADTCIFEFILFTENVEITIEI